MRVNTGLLGWGLFLITLGAVPIAVRGGYLDEDVVRRAWELWPLILIGIGVGLLLQRTQVAAIGGLIVAVTVGLMAGSVLAVGISGGLAGCGLGAGGGGSSFAQQAGTLGGDARVRLEMNCGEVVVQTASGSGWTLTGSSDGGRVPRIDAGSDRLTIRTAENRGFVIPVRESWQLSLPTDPRQRIDLQLNAGSAQLDLGGAHVPQVDLNVNAGEARLDLSAATEVDQLEAHVKAGSLKLTLPAASMTGSMSANAGSIEVCVPSSAALRFRTSNNPLSSNNFGDRGLQQDGGVWSTPGFDSATVRLDFSAQATAGAITLNPEAGCD